MRRMPLLMLLPLMLLAACQSAPSGDAGSNRPCTPREQDAGQCGARSISSFPELSNIN